MKLNKKKISPRKGLDICLTQKSLDICTQILSSVQIQYYGYNIVHSYMLNNAQ